MAAVDEDSLAVKLERSQAPNKETPTTVDQTDLEDEPVEVEAAVDNPNPNPNDGEAAGEPNNPSRCSRQIEEHPWSLVSYIFSTIQFMLITLDLFMDTSQTKQVHYAIASIEFIMASYLAVYENVRLVQLISWCYKDNHKSIVNKATLLLLLCLLAQAAIFALSFASYWDNNDSLEWSMFVIGIFWGIFHPATFGAVIEIKTSDSSKKDNDDLSPLSAVYSIFRYHFIRTPLLSFLGIVFATLHALLSTYQGAIVNDLTKAVTKKDDKGMLKASEEDVRNLSLELLCIWLASIVAKFIFDICSSAMFSRLEVWLRRTVFEKGVAAAGDSSSNVAVYQTNYASDVSGVVGLYNSLLKGVVVNLLLMVTAFAYLAVEEWKIACVTLAFLAIAVNSGPTSLAAASAGETQRLVTSGISMLSASSEQQQQTLFQEHEDQVLKPLQKSLFKRTFYTASVETYISFFSTFLTAIVVITMSWAVFYGEMDSSDFLGIFFVFKQLQKPATKLSGIIKKLVKQTASVSRVNAVVLDSKKTN